jgi:hypothetical protein
MAANQAFHPTPENLAAGSVAARVKAVVTDTCSYVSNIL